MTVIKQTISMCSKCYRQVTATVKVREAVTITKHCPVHGDETGILETDIGFYMEAQRLQSKIYGGHLVDVTTRCNLDCKYCYYQKGGKDFSSAEIADECRLNTGPYILTGGEPTLRQDLPELLVRCNAIGPTLFLTNGTGLLDKNYLAECASAVSERDGFKGIGLSYHAEMDRFDDVVENIKSAGIRIDTVFFVIDSLEQIDQVIAWSRANRGLAATVRIKAASNIWDEGKAGKLYNSQILKAFQKRGPVIVSPDFKSVYMPFLFDGMVFSAISWHDISNVDLLDINCPPTYRAKTGEVCDFVRAMLINQGLQKGFMNGVAI